MFDAFRRVLTTRARADVPSPDLHAPAPAQIAADSLPPFPIASHIEVQNGFPIVDWIAVRDWIEPLASPDKQGEAWTSAERAWLLHFREALGEAFRLTESSGTALLSSLDAGIARASVEYVDRTLRRIVHVLEDIAHVSPHGKDILIVFDDQESYYEYVACYHPEEGEFAFSGGMFINAGCGHFVTVKSDLQALEPVIAHEMTHGCVAHLPLPAWLNEGIAVNTEQRLTRVPPPLHTPAEMQQKHLRFWGEREAQEFWSGKSFLRTDDGNLLSYDLARILVEHLASAWEPFKRFVLAADRADGGAAAAREHLGVDLGELLSALLGKDGSNGWAPDAGRWEGEPEKGGFRRLWKTPAWRAPQC